MTTQSYTCERRDASRQALRRLRDHLLMAGCAFSFRSRSWLCPSCRRYGALRLVPRSDGGVTLHCATGLDTGPRCSEGRILEALGLLYRDVAGRAVPGRVGGAVMPSNPTKRDLVRDLFLKFVKGFSKEPPHAEKIERYLDVFEGFALDELAEAFAALRSEASLPSPKKIREAVAGAALLRRLEREAKERADLLATLADPEKRAEMRESCAAQAVSLLGRHDLLGELVKDAEILGLVGEERAATLIFLAMHTRHFAFPERPVSAVVKGTSSTGKSWLVKTMIRFFAPGSVIEMTGMSAKWMVYAAQQGIDFAHKMLFVHEACGVDDEVQKMLRVLLSEGRIVWRTVIEQQAHTLIVEGPTGLIETTTELAIHWENETRLLSIPVDESTSQTARVLGRLGNGADEVDLGRWHALDQWIALGPRDAVIPFQPVIGKLTKPIAPRVRRDLTTLLELVRAHALVHEGLREYDEAGRVVATLEDYEAVYDLARELFAAAVELIVNENVRDVVVATAEVIAPRVEKGDGTPPVATSAEVARKLARDRRSVNRWIEAAIEAEFLEDPSPRPGQGVAHRLRLGSRPLPERSASVFPTRKEIEAAVSGCSPSAQAPKSEADLDTWAVGTEPETLAGGEDDDDLGGVL